MLLSEEYILSQWSLVNSIRFIPSYHRLISFILIFFDLIVDSILNITGYLVYSISLWHLLCFSKTSMVMSLIVKWYLIFKSLFMTFKWPVFVHFICQTNWKSIHWSAELKLWWLPWILTILSSILRWLYALVSCLWCNNSSLFKILRTFPQLNKIS